MGLDQKLRKCARTKLIYIVYYRLCILWENNGHTYDGAILSILVIVIHFLILFCFGTAMGLGVS